jgi:predicted acetyltransferase
MRIFYDDQKELEEIFREMWRDIFGDPAEYESFYFENMYSKNQVISMEQDGEITGMIHLNPYSVSINNTLHDLHYIVGVATLAKCRRQGIMRKLLVKSMQDMAGNGEIFTYLMPANKAYYEPFDFAFVQKFQTECIMGKQTNTDLSILKTDEYQEASDFVNHYLSDTKSVFTKFDPDYLKQLAYECACEDGALLCLKKDGRIIGFCCYGQDEEQVYVRQIFCEDKKQMIEGIRGYFPKRQIELTLDGGQTGEGASIMARILRLDRLMPLMKARKEMEILIEIEDQYIDEQNGNFRIIIGENGGKLERDLKQTGRKITIRDLTKILFGFECKDLLLAYPEFQSVIPLSPVMIGEII